VALVSYPGKVYEAIDGGEDNFSSVLVYDENWHELYRGPETGDSIYNMYHQAIPGDDIGRLWLSMNADTLYLPTAMNPEQQADYPFTHESVIQTGRIHFDLQDVTKFLFALTLATENLNLSGATRKIAVDYRTDSETSWTAFSSDFWTSPYEQIEFDSTNKDTSGKWVELRIRLQSTTNLTSPVLIAAVIEGMYRGFEDKPKYTLTIRLAEGSINRDLREELDDIAGYTKLSQIDTWLEDPLPILMETNSNYEDSVWVMPQPTPIQILNQMVEDDEELRVAQLELVSV
jgi:hypothetical protein